jgi:hypothetical protein
LQRIQSVIKETLEKRLFLSYGFMGRRFLGRPGDASLLRVLRPTARVSFFVITRGARRHCQRCNLSSEVTKAFAEERQRGGMVLFPARLDDAVFVTREAWALKLRDNRHIGDFHAWTDHDAYQRTPERLLRDLRVETPDAAPG